MIPFKNLIFKAYKMSAIKLADIAAIGGNL
jgi:hypothetical protein